MLNLSNIFLRDFGHCFNFGLSSHTSLNFNSLMYVKQRLLVQKSNGGILQYLFILLTLNIHLYCSS